MVRNLGQKTERRILKKIGARRQRGAIGGAIPLLPIGEKFGRLTIVSTIVSRKHGARYVLCRCDCGKQRPFAIYQLKTGSVRSCGCLRRDSLLRRNTTHGKSHLVEYSIWAAMIQRCTNPRDKEYPLYGGRGIGVCERWLTNFEAFFEDMGIRSPDGELDRINNDRSYEPGNCRWASRRQQALNTRANRLLSYNGKTQTMLEWATTAGLNYQTLSTRLNLGWSVARALETPVRKLKLPNLGFAIEKRILKSLGARRHPRSGGIPGLPNDGVLGRFLLEIKSTIRAERAIKYEWLQKLEENAILLGKIPVLIVVFSDPKMRSMEQWVAVPRRDFERITKEWKKS